MGEGDGGVVVRVRDVSTHVGGGDVDEADGARRLEQAKDDEEGADDLRREDAHL